MNGAVKTQTRLRDAELVERAIEGDRAAFDALTRRYLGKCYRIARHLGLSAEDAADAVQDTFLAAYRAIERFDFSYQFSTWITRILLNRVSNVQRGLRRARRVFFKSEPLPLEWIADSGLSPQESAERSELRARLQQALKKLPKPQRTVLILFEIEGFKAREIARMLDIPEGTVTSRLHHARRRMRQLLKSYLQSGAGK